MTKKVQKSTCNHQFKRPKFFSTYIFVMPEIFLYDNSVDYYASTIDHFGVLMGCKSVFTSLYQIYFSFASDCVTSSNFSCSSPPARTGTFG